MSSRVGKVSFNGPFFCLVISSNNYRYYQVDAMEGTVSLEFIEMLEGVAYKPHSASSLFSSLSSKDRDRLRVEMARRSTRDSTPLVRCYFCREPVFLKQHGNKGGGTLFFSHYKAEEGEAECPQRTSYKIPAAVIDSIRERCTQESTV